MAERSFGLEARSMRLPGGTRKLALTVHVASSVGFLGAVASFLALAVIGLATSDAVVLTASYVAMDLITWWAVVPLCVAALLGGVLSSLASPWGLLRYYWVVVKLVLTALSLAILLVHAQPIGALAAAAAAGAIDHADIGTRRQLAAAAAAAIVAILLMTILSIYKPRGMTRYGSRQRSPAAG
jgi:hypothetical protein